jgi:hypothetical protein
MDTVLINAPYHVKSEEYLGVAVIKQAFKESRKEVRIQAINNFSVDSLSENSIVGLSAYYEELDQFIPLSLELQSKGHFVVLGGHGANFPQNNQMMLGKGYFNAINRGHASPFINFRKKVAENSSLETMVKLARESGLATSGRQFVKNGEFPAIKEFPLVSYSIKDPDLLVIPAMRNCQNGCDFCNEKYSRMPDITDIIISSLQKREKKEPIKGLSFTSPTFNEDNIADIRKILSAINSRPEIAVYVDSAQIGDAKTQALLDEFNATKLYIGLNAINDKSAKYIGRRENGRIRKNIQSEKKAILDYLEKKRNVDGEEEYVISIMYSKADTRKEIASMILFVNDVWGKLYKNREKNALIHLNQAIPLVQTRFASEHAEDYNMKNYSDYSLGLSHNSNILNFRTKGEDFFRRVVVPRYYMGIGKEKALRVAATELLFAFEHVFTGKINSYDEGNEEFKKVFADDVEYIKNPALVPKNGKITVINTPDSTYSEK